MFLGSMWVNHWSAKLLVELFSPNRTRYNKLPLFPRRKAEDLRIDVAFFSKSYCSFLLRVYSWKVFEHLSCLMKGSFHPGYV